jgi:hypothetical protein
MGEKDFFGFEHVFALCAVIVWVLFVADLIFWRICIRIPTSNKPF